ncbi:hypothetical protein E3T43_07155 [Cryobacterium sp. Hh7]|uniref:hypothetical protein n=1 Tax=Cryobacterium sp. Hh7 TaxID=1259159 RepID=UPI00106996C9|nr:hypothetical protein [Cryobacterium sp. Hh7]TFD58020.1 hypothetical protein E3T43_07155 [Cryobacterium sp. Hh7]
MPKTAEELAAEEAAATAAAEAAKDKTPITDPALTAALADVDKWKALSRKNEADKNSNAEKAQKWDAKEDGDRTDLEKANARADAAEKIVSEGTAREATKTLRTEVATAKKFADRKIPESALRGTTREELEAHADELLLLIPAPAPAADADGQGDKGGRIGDGEMSADDIVAKATAR